MLFYAEIQKNKNIAQELREANAMSEATIKDLQDQLEYVKDKNSFSLKIQYDNTNHGTITESKLKEMNLDGFNKLMITTHPDDETFWAGAHLLQDKYLVVCVMCGLDENRQTEFENVMKEVKSKYIMLGYPRSIEGLEKFNWETMGYLTQDLENVLNAKNWQEIVTHNPDGEYGHRNHKITNQIVTSLVKDKKKLYYFGKYYFKNETDKLSKNTLTKEQYNKKIKMIKKYYVSQKGSAKKHKQMFNNENFINYYDWH